MTPLIIIGLMSGTSADGIDVALCEIDGAPPHLSARILGAQTFPYSAAMRARILDACVPQTGTVDALCLLNAELAELFAETCLTLMSSLNLRADLIASHGQTVWHYVRDNGQVAATLQIGEASVIAERTGITTVSNFRARDVAAGGQGAPLVGYLDTLLLRHESRWRAIQNLGGIANVSFLPPLSLPDALPVMFDTGPGNGLIDAAVFELAGVRYDEDGHMALRGKVDEAWLAALMQHSYYERKPPKTTGRELFSTGYALERVREGQARGLPLEDIIATLTALTAESIVDSYRRFAPARIEEIILAGGGRHNRALVKRLQTELAPAALLMHEDIGINGDFKEALAFAVLGYETWHQRPGSLPSQTGARHPVVLGQITPGDNYAALLRQTWMQSS